MKTNEEKREYNKQYYIRNKEKLNSINNEYYLSNSDKIKNRAKKHYQDNKERYKSNNKKYRENNLDKIKEKQKDWYLNNPDKVKNLKLNKSYNITLDEYNKMFTEQNGKCCICGVHQDELKQKLSVDHDHCTGKIRGLLCNKCNRGLGYFNDDIELLRKAVNYLVT